MASLTLLWLASYSNLTSIIVIVLCFFAMTIFIGFVSISWDQSGRTSIATGVAQRNMVKVCNPFVLHLAQTNTQLKDGLHMKLSSLCPSKIFIIWGAKINPFHDLILKTGRHICSVLESGDHLALEALHADQVSFPEAGEHNLSLPCPAAVSSQILGDMPRVRYPVSVFTLVNDEQIITSLPDEDNSILGLVSIIHLQDDKVTQNSHIIRQFVKTTGVQLYSLQPLYLSSGSEVSHVNKSEATSATLDDFSQENILDTGTIKSGKNTRNNPKDISNHPENDKDSDVTHSSSGSDSEGSDVEEKPRVSECVVCQSRQAKCALLPCRHACVCLGCFRLLDRCPMCRGDIDSYFLLSDSDDDSLEEDSVTDLQHQAVSEYFSQAWERFNIRLNTFLGFR
ncbi:cell growth regulator with RING finger domain protein 1 [Biomphalaria glabrata]|nr:cell growth regulator with RING finger domain protein 1 [Biomphalaria glabrata]